MLPGFSPKKPGTVKPDCGFRTGHPEARIPVVYAGNSTNPMFSTRGRDGKATAISRLESRNGSGVRSQSDHACVWTKCGYWLSCGRIQGAFRHCAERRSKRRRCPSSSVNRQESGEHSGRVWRSLLSCSAVSFTDVFKVVCSVRAADFRHARKRAQCPVNVAVGFNTTDSAVFRIPPDRHFPSALILRLHGSKFMIGTERAEHASGARRQFPSG